MNIDFVKRDVYGKTLRYAVDQTQADALNELTGKKTIDLNDMAALRTLGFTFTEVLR